MKFDAIILAGARIRKKLKDISQQDYEALITINNKALIDYVVKIFKELQEKGVINKLIIVGPKELKDRYQNIVHIKNNESLIENIKAGLEVSEGEYSLISTSDIPLINAEAVENFLQQSSQSQADFYYPIIEKEIIKRKFSQIRGTYIKLEEGDFTGGNIFLARKEAVLGLEKFLDKILRWRKKPWKLAYLFGFKFIIKLLTGKLSLPFIEDEIYDLTGYRAKTILLDYPGVGFDIDSKEDFEIIHKFMI